MNSTISATQAGELALKHLHELNGEHRVAVGLSGGVDSSLTAALLVEAGWHVEGITLWLLSGKGACCSDGLIDAAGICKQLGIPHHIIDSRSKFEKEIVEHLVNGYRNGTTPLPCSRCNRFVKFNSMLEWSSKELNLERIATGHYARIRNPQNADLSDPQTEGSKGRYHLLRGKDKNKDQSYFLYDLSQEILSRVVFPLGELTKEETRCEANRYELRTAKKPESQDLCLADHHGSMKAFLDSYIPPSEGEIVLKDGTILGKHDGIEHFTIGQRKGLGVSWSEPLHVISLDAIFNKVVVAPRSESGDSSCIVKSINWVSISPPPKPISVEVQVRYRSNPVIALLTPISPTDEDSKNNRPYRCKLDFKEKQFSITPGQAAVFYKQELVLGGGIIEKK